MNALNICLFAVAFVGFATDAVESQAVAIKLGRAPTTIWEEYCVELQNKTTDTATFVNYGVKAGVQGLKSKVQDQVETLYRLTNVEAVTVRLALENILLLIAKVEEYILTLETSLGHGGHIPTETYYGAYRLSTARSTDGLDELLTDIGTLDELLKTLIKIIQTFLPPPTTTTAIPATTAPATRPTTLTPTTTTRPTRPTTLTPTTTTRPTRPTTLTPTTTTRPTRPTTLTPTTTERTTTTGTTRLV